MRLYGSFCAECIERRRVRGPRGRDLFYHLVNEEAGPDAFPPRALVIENTKVVIIAGSDTTSTTLNGVFFYLMKDVNVLRRLGEELDAAFPPNEGDPFDFTRLAELPFLNAVMCVLDVCFASIVRLMLYRNETLRLQPPVPTDLQRAPIVGSGFKQIGEQYACFQPR